MARFSNEYGRAGNEISRVSASIWLLVLVLAAFLVRFAIGYYQPISYDGCGYVMQAWSLYEGKITTPYWASGVDHYYQPLYPLLISLGYRVLHDWERSAKLVNHLLGALLLVPFYLLGRRIYGRAGGIIAAALLVSYPVLAEHGAKSASEPAFLAAFGFGLYAWHRFIEEQKLKLALFSGLGFGIAYLARNQAITFAAIAAFTFIWQMLRKRLPLRASLLGLVLLLAGFYLFALPYDYYCFKKDGVYNLRVKQEFFKRTTESLTKQYFIEERSLDPDAKVLRNFLFARTESPVRYIFSNPRDFLQTVAREFRHTFKDLFKSGSVISVLIAALLFLALIAAASGKFPARSSRGMSLYFFWIFFLVFLPPLSSQTTTRYFAVLAPFLALFGAGGVLFLRGLCRNLKLTGWLASGPGLAVWVTAVLLLFPHAQLREQASQKTWVKSKKYDADLAAWLSQKLRANRKIIMIENSSVPMITGNYWYMFPFDYPLRVARYAQAQKVDYLVVERRRLYWTAMPSDWSDYLLSPGDKPGLTWLGNYPEGSGTPAAVLYQVQPEKPENPAPPNIVLIALGSLRPDHVSAFGHQPANTPNLARLAAEGVAFDHALAASAETDWSVLSILNSMYLEVPVSIYLSSSRHGQEQAGFKVINLAEFLKTRGYQTAAFTGFPPSVGAFELFPLSGFDSFHSDFSGRGPDELQNISSWMDHLDPSRPFFAFLHVDLDPGLKNALAQAQASGQKPTSSEIENLSARYDAGLQSEDEMLGTLRAELEKRGLAGEKTIIIVTSDHGVELGEHGGFLYNQLYREVANVPLVLVWPGHLPAGKINSSQVRLLDLAPTVLDYAGLDSLPQTSGVSLKPIIESGDKADLSALTDHLPSPAPANSKNNPAFSQAFRVSGWLFYQTGKDASIFSLDDDPGEKIDLLAPNNFAGFMPGASEKEKVARLRDIYYTLSESAHDLDYFNLKHLEKYSQTQANPRPSMP